MPELQLLFRKNCEEKSGKKIGDPEEVPVTSLTYSNMETRMDRPKSVVRVIRGVA